MNVTMFVKVNAIIDCRGNVKLDVEYPVIDEKYFTLASRWMGILFIIWIIISITEYSLCRMGIPCKLCDDFGDLHQNKL